MSKIDKYFHFAANDEQLAGREWLRKYLQAYEAAKAPVSLEDGARAIAAIRFPHAPAVTPQSREFAKACAKAWGIEYVED